MQMEFISFSFPISALLQYHIIQNVCHFQRLWRFKRFQRRSVLSLPFKNALKKQIWVGRCEENQFEWVMSYENTFHIDWLTHLSFPV